MKQLFLTILFFNILFLTYGQDPDVIKSDAIMAESIDDFSSAAQLYLSAFEAYEHAGKFDTVCIYRAGVNYYKIKDFERAISLFERMETLKMVSVNLYFSLSDSYLSLAKYDEARNALFKVIELYPEEKNSAYRRLVTIFYKSHDFGSTLEYTDKYLKGSPNDSYILFIKMMAYAQLRKLDEAVSVGEQLLSVDPEHQQGNEQMGIILCKITDLKYEREKRKYASLSNPSRVDYSNTTKKLAAISQEYRKAIPYLEKALSKNPNNASLKVALDNAQRRLKE
ncbi:tetratricopeptide repeat protein [Geofilum sp. OHC36d9]|uniref:tetratricopeptide repeat protein n=1 Tax=Geofilum sp. OHC36d9 TaxID=3458413 RepID=UPI0040333C2D